MSNLNGTDSTSSRISAKTIVGCGIAALLIIFVLVNRDDTEISFIFFSAQTALWVALAIAAVGGFIAGFLIGRSRYKN